MIYLAEDSSSARNLCAARDDSTGIESSFLSSSAIIIAMVLRLSFLLRSSKVSTANSLKGREPLNCFVSDFKSSRLYYTAMFFYFFGERSIEGFAGIYERWVKVKELGGGVGAKQCLLVKGFGAEMCKNFR